MKLQGSDETQAEFPLMTVGISCFNAENTIARAIESAMKQDWCNKEIVIVDDASTDGSAAMLQKIAQQHPGLRVIRQTVQDCHC